MDVTSVSLNEFAQARAPEISSLLKVICSNKEDVCKTASNCLDFQCMPVHLRRRSAGRKFYEHNKNKIAKTSKRKFIKERYKNRARINRRKKELTEFLRNRISTHVWHAKRFHMVELYNYRLPFCTTSKTYRPIHRAICSSVCLQDISYFNLITISGALDSIFKIFNLHMNHYSKHLNRECCALFLSNPSSGNGVPIGPVLVSNMKHLMEHVGLVWCHPLMTQDICNCLQISNIDGLKIETVYNVSRLRLVGPLSMEAILTLIDPRDQSEFGLTCKSFEKHLVSCDIFENGRIFGLPIRCKTIKKHYGSFYKTMGSKSTEKPDSGLLDSLKVPDGLVDSLLSFAGSEFEDFPVLMVVKRESNKKDKIKDSSIILKSNVPQGLPSGLSTGIDIICPRIAAKQVLNFLVFHGANIGGLREYRTVGLESFSRQYPEDYPNTCDLKTIELKPINVSNRKLLKRLKKIDTYYKKIQQLLINLSGSNSFSIYGSQSAIVGTCSEQEQDFIFVGLVMDSKGVPTRLDPIYNIKTEVADLNLEEGDKEANFEIVGHVTDGDMSLSMGRGVGKGVVLTKHWNSFQEIKKIKRGYIKASNGAFYKCKLFIINKYFL